jgi:hypothetical protein
VKPAKAPKKSAKKEQQPTATSDHMVEAFPMIAMISEQVRTSIPPRTYPDGEERHQ